MGKALSLPQLLLSENMVNTYLLWKPNRARGSLQAVLLKMRGTPGLEPGEPSALLVFESGGEQTIAEISVNVFSAISAGLVAGAIRAGWRWPAKST